MTSNKIIYGIDLGTTNSAIARFEKGKATIIKSGHGSDITPSCVGYKLRKKVVCGVNAKAMYGGEFLKFLAGKISQMNSYVEFKRNIGTDHTYYSSNLEKNISPVELSSEILKELKKYVLDDEVRTAVITVPAMFTNNQKDATKRAAKDAGFDFVELIQEPVAASIAYGMDSCMKNSYWLVFDFGGGTFDAALMKIEDGIMQAIDTAGNNKLGGKDIDRAIVEGIFLPYLKERFSIDGCIEQNNEYFINVWKEKAEEAKIALSFNESYDVETDLDEDYGIDDNGVAFELDFTISREQLENVAAPIYQKAIDITKELLKRNNINGESLGALILVGGPTMSPIIRKMLKEQVSSKVDTSIDPMTCVARGAALYGSTVDVPEQIVDMVRDRSKIQLAVSVKSTSVNTMECAAVRLLAEKSDNYDENEVFVNFVREDGLFDSGKVEIDTNGNIIELFLKENCTNVFAIHCYNKQGDAVECEPNTISIIQGFDGFGDAVLPMALGLGTSNRDNEEIFTPIEGLEKSRKLPTYGVIRGLKTPHDLRPGNASDHVRISLYQLDESNTEKRPKALYCEHLYDVLLTGDDIPSLLPEDSEINIRLHAERSGTIDSVIVDIPQLDIEIDLTDRITSTEQTTISSSFVDHEIAMAKKKAYEMNDFILANKISEAEKQFDNCQDRDATDQAFANLKSILLTLDNQYSEEEFSRRVKKLKNIFEELVEDNKKYGNEETTVIIEKLRPQIEEIIASKNVELAKQMYDVLWSLDYKIAEVEFYIAWITNWNRDFDKKRWNNRAKARELVDRGMQIIGTHPTANSLHSIAYQLLDMLPDKERPDVPKGPVQK